MVFVFLVVKPSPQITINVDDIRGTNIAGTPSYSWGEFWLNFDKAKTELRKEFYLASQLGLNLIEVYVIYSCFPDYDYGKVRELLRIARSYNLYVIVTLNDDIYDDNINYDYVARHIETCVKAIRSEPNLYAIGILNEYNTRIWGTNTSFAEFTIKIIRKLTDKPIVLDLMLFDLYVERFSPFRDLDVDMFSFSMYNILPQFYEYVLDMAEKILEKPCFIGEFGARSDPPFNEETQAAFYREALKNLEHGWLFWCLTDYKGLKEQWGIYTVDFHEKKTVEVLREVLGGESID
jgi:hypothetical protein